jgi:proteic killer suppression protein
MVVSFGHKGLKRLFEDGDGSGLNPQHLERIENILGLLDSAEKIEDMALPSLRLHPLTGKLNGFWSVTVRANWRIVFRFEEGDARAVDLIDYH